MAPSARPRAERPFRFLERTFRSAIPRPRTLGALLALALAVPAARAQQPELPEPSADTAAYRAAVQAWRAEGDAAYRTEGESPFRTRRERRRFPGRAWFPVDPAARVSARVERFAVPDTLDFPTSAGTVKRYLRWGRLTFTYRGHTDTLTAYRSVRHLGHPAYGRLLFVPFTDHTSGEASYGGGRYLDPTLPGEGQDRLVLDFNTAYNPWCAYADGWFCPIPPVENRLGVAVEAGEKAFAGGDH